MDEAVIQQHVPGNADVFTTQLPESDPYMVPDTTHVPIICSSSSSSSSSEAKDIEPPSAAAVLKDSDLQLQQAQTPTQFVRRKIVLSYSQTVLLCANV